MSTTRIDGVSKETDLQDLSGCDMMKLLWKHAKDCNLEHPGIEGAPSRISSMVKCSNIRPFMEFASLKCWEERTVGCGAAPFSLFTPVDRSRDEKTTQSRSNDEANQQQPSTRSTKSV